MKSSTKFWLALFTFLPLIFLFIFLGFFFTTFFENIVELEHNQGEFPLQFIQSFAWFIFLIILMAIVGLGIKIYYIVHVNNNSKNDSNTKIMWTLLLIFIGLIGSIVYYFIEIVPLKPIDKN